MKQWRETHENVEVKCASSYTNRTSLDQLVNPYEPCTDTIFRHEEGSQ
jgi:hypothetical protein